MADKYLLEDGSGYYTLEDNSGHYLLEDGTGDGGGGLAAALRRGALWAMAFFNRRKSNRGGR